MWQLYWLKMRNELLLLINYDLSLFCMACEMVYDNTGMHCDVTDNNDSRQLSIVSLILYI